MCGIAGIARLNKPVETSEIQLMTDYIRHRGPDGWGYKEFKNGSIGHRRLSIIDLESGKQPMSNEDGTIWITFNGEIYNFKELEAELKAAGHTFKTNSDTEAIIHGYEQWGYDVLKRLRGMFSFAIVDEKKEKIFAARDHFGIKPFYYLKTDEVFAFGSELQEFKAVKEFKPDLSLEAIDEYLCLQYIPAPKTVFKNVFKLQAAHYIVYNFNGKLEQQTPYWDIDFSRKKIKTEKEWLAITDEILKKSVEAHLVSDVAFGAFLSGGIDSTLVVSYMSKILKQPVKTFSIGFDEDDFNELEYSKLAAAKYKTEHHTEIVKPDALGILPTLVNHYGEPFGDSSAIPTYYVCQLARKHVTMTLSGDGGDEGFAGYGSYLSWMKYQPENLHTGLKKQLYPYYKKLFPNKYPKKEMLQSWLGQIAYLPVEWRSRLWKNEYREVISQTPTGFEKLFDKAVDYTPANRVQYMDMKTYMNFDILTKVDVAAMIHSLEVRTPLIDKEVWEMAATIPEEFNINNKAGEWRGKLLLKNILQKDFKEDFIHRRKQGFAVPLSKWFSNEGELRGLLEDKLLSEKSLLNTYFNHKTIREIIDNKLTGPLWLLLFLEEWMENFLKSAPEKKSGTVTNA